MPNDQLSPSTPYVLPKWDTAVFVGTLFLALSTFFWPLTAVSFVLGAVAAGRSHVVGGALLMAFSVILGCFGLIVTFALL